MQLLGILPEMSPKLVESNWETQIIPQTEVFEQMGSLETCPNCMLL